MTDRHPKWVRVEPGTVIPAGQPYRVEYPEMSPEHYGRNVAAIDRDGNSETTGAFKPIHHGDYVETSRWFVDSSWKPPLDLPTEPTWGIAIVHTHKIAYAGKWTVQRDGDKTWFVDVLPGGITTGAAGVSAFIPLTDEQVARIEAAR